MEDAYKRVPAELVFEDYNSSLWFGSPKGLFLYDGIEFHPFQKEDSTSNHVTSIFRDSKKRLWVGYQDGGIYFFEKQKLKPWPHQAEAPGTSVLFISEDGNGHIWMLAEEDGIFVYDGLHIFQYSQKGGLAGNEISTMAVDAKGKVWLGTDEGIKACSFAEGEIFVEDLPIESNASIEHANFILPDKNGHLWVGTSHGEVYQIDLKTKEKKQLLSDRNLGSIKNLELYERTELWIGTDENGVWRYALTDGTLRHLSDFEKTKVHDLHRDIEGNIWALTEGHGIQSANRQFEFIPTGFENVRAVLNDAKGRLWVGTPEGLFVHKLDDSGLDYFQKHLPQLKLNILSLHEDRYGNIWIGTLGKGPYVYQPSSGHVRRVSGAKELIEGDILSIAGTKADIWLATHTGAVRGHFQSDFFSGAKPIFQTIGKEDGLVAHSIYKVFSDRKGRVWLGTNGHGISLWENGQVKNFPVAEHIHVGKAAEEGAWLNAVYSITEDANGHIWFSTDSAGIFEFDGENFSHLDLKEGIRDLEITSLVTDAKGQILIVHPSGVDVLTPESKHLIYYDDEVGIRDFDPRLNASCTDRFGNVWIGGKNTIIKYTALKEELEIHPRTSLSNVSVLLEPIDFANKKVLSHNENYLAFNYMGLWYTDPEIVKYRYQLVGYDLNWIESKDRQATYSNLRPGEYTFRVTSTENDAWADEPVVSYKFKIKNPIWMRWWFFALLFPALFGLFLLYQKNRDRRIQLVNLMEKDKAESKLATLKAQINPHFLFNSFNTLISVVEKTPDQAVEYIENLSDFYRKIMQLRDKDIISVREEVELLQNYTYLLKKRYGNNFHLHIDLPAREWFIVPLTLQLLVENAVKHNIISKGKPLTVHIREEDGEFITVSNNFQPKLTQEKSTYFGLQSLVQRYGFLNSKKVKVDKDSQEFKVSIPIIS